MDGGPVEAQNQDPAVPIPETAASSCSSSVHRVDEERSAVDEATPLTALASPTLRPLLYYSRGTVGERARGGHSC